MKRLYFDMDGVLVDFASGLGKVSGLGYRYILLVRERWMGNRKGMRKVLFLDIDGVLNTESWHTHAVGGTAKDQYGYTFDPVAVGNLKRIVDATGADIVISSSWKFMGLSTLLEMWEDRGLPGRVIDITPNAWSDEMLLNTNIEDLAEFSGKGYEIKEWMARHGKKVSNYVIVDDANEMLTEQQSHFIEVCPNIGITEQDAEDIIKLLNQ